jgi:prepilin-type N-terminal cleavage/methylation domain-containing protein/prepilin-type processing-associated H-X9-DG protein
MRPRGFTYIEMLFVIAAIAILAAILFPVFARARERARTHSCVSNLVNIGFALQMYAEDHAGHFPPTEDDLSPLLGRYIRWDVVFTCPSAFEGTPMGAPANPKPTRVPSHRDSREPLRTSYYYRAGRTPNDAPSRPVLSDQTLVHSEHANVLFSDGHAATLEDSAWRALGFRPLTEVWAPTRPEGAPGSGMGGTMGAPPKAGGGAPK